jgi:hypothetical protein
LCGAFPSPHFYRQIIDGLKHNKVIPPSEIDAPGAPPPAAVKRKRDSPGKKANGDVEEEAEDGEVTEEKDEDEVKGGKAGDSTAKADDKKDTEPNESASKTSDRSPVKKASSRSNSDSTSTSDEHPSAAKKARTSPTKASKSAPAPSASSKMDTDAPAAAEEDAPEDPSAASNAKAGKEVPNLPGDAAAPSEDHLSHPEEWATGQFMSISLFSSDSSMIEADRHRCFPSRIFALFFPSLPSFLFLSTFQATNPPPRSRRVTLRFSRRRAAKA